jgi:hypothetical protein
VKCQFGYRKVRYRGMPRMARRCSRSWHSLTCTSPAGRLRLPDDDSGQNSPACHRRRGNFCQRRSLRSQPPSAAPASAWRPAPRRPRRTPLHDCERAPGGGWNCCGVRDREIPVRIGLHGGAGRIRTSHQTVMSRRSAKMRANCGHFRWRHIASVQRTSKIIGATMGLGQRLFPRMGAARPIA